MVTKDAYIERKEMEGREREESLSSVIRIEPRRKSPKSGSKGGSTIEGAGKGGGVKGGRKRHGNFSGALLLHRESIDR